MKIAAHGSSRGLAGSTIIRRFLTLRANGNRAALGYMLTAALFYSMTFPAIELAQAGQNPLAFTAMWHLGSAITTSALIAVRFPRLLSNPRVRREIRQRIPSRDFWLGTCSDSASLLLAASTAFVDEAVAAVIARFWPILIVLLLSRHQRYQQNLRRVLPAMLAALLGFSLVAAAQTGFNPTQQEVFRTALGVLMALMGAGAIGLSVHMLRWSFSLAETLAETGDARELEMMGTLTAWLFSTCLWAPGMALAALLLREQPDARTLMIGLTLGMTTSAIADITWFRAAIASSNLGIHAAAYATPLLSLTWLALLGGISIQQPELLVLGALLILGANVVANRGRTG